MKGGDVQLNQLLGKAAAVVVIISAGIALAANDLEAGLNAAMAMIMVIGLMVALVRFKKQQEVNERLKKEKFTPYQLKLLGSIAYVPGREPLQLSDELRRRHKGN